MSYLLLFKNIAIAFRLNSLLNIILTFIYQHTAYTLLQIVRIFIPEYLSIYNTKLMLRDFCKL